MGLVKNTFSNALREGNLQILEDYKYLNQEKHEIVILRHILPEFQVDQCGYKGCLLINHTSDRGERVLIGKK